MNRVFRPTGDNVTVAASAVSASAVVSETNLAGPGKMRVMRLVNGSALAAPQTMFVKTSVGSSTATSAGAALAAGAELIIPYPTDHTHVAVIASGAASLYAQAGVLESCD